MTEHQRLTLSARRPTAFPEAAYQRYVERCHGEALEPLSRVAWNVCRQPLTQESMEKAWARMTGSRVWQGWRRGLDDAMRAA